MKRPFVVIYGWMTFRRASRLQHARAQPAGKINLSTSMRRKLNSSISPKFTSTVLLNRKVSRQRLRVWFHTCEFFFLDLKIRSGVAQMLLVFIFSLLFCFLFCFLPQDLERSCSDVACFLFYPQSLPYPIGRNRRSLAVKLLFREDSCKFMH